MQERGNDGREPTTLHSCYWRG